MQSMQKWISHCHSLELVLSVKLNTAQLDGGTISANINMSVSFTGTSRFYSYSAMVGGGISANRNSTLTFDGNISFTNNGHNTDKLNNF